MHTKNSKGKKGKKHVHLMACTHVVPLLALGVVPHVTRGRQHGDVHNGHAGGQQVSPPGRHLVVVSGGHLEPCKSTPINNEHGAWPGLQDHAATADTRLR